MDANPALDRLVDAVGERFAVVLAKRIATLHAIFHAFETFPEEEEECVSLLQVMLEELEQECDGCPAALRTINIIRELGKEKGWINGQGEIAKRLN